MPTAKSSLSKEASAAIAQRAVDWVKSVSKSVKQAADADKAAILAAEEYDASAYLARIAVADKVRQILRAANRAIRTGEISSTWANGDPALDALSAEGLGKYDPRTLFQTTLRSAYNAGSWQEAQTDDSIEYLEYVTMRDSHVRYSHSVLDSVCLPKNHPWWALHTPPLAPNCRCKIRLRTKGEFSRLLEAGDVRDEVPAENEVTHRNRATGETVKLPQSIAPGFGFNPGSPDAIDEFRKMLEQRMKVLLEAPADLL